MASNDTLLFAALGVGLGAAFAWVRNRSGRTIFVPADGTGDGDRGDSGGTPTPSGIWSGLFPSQVGKKPPPVLNLRPAAQAAIKEPYTNQYGRSSNLEVLFRKDEVRLKPQSDFIKVQRNPRTGKIFGRSTVSGEPIKSTGDLPWSAVIEMLAGHSMFRCNLEISAFPKDIRLQLAHDNVAFCEAADEPGAPRFQWGGFATTWPITAFVHPTRTHPFTTPHVGQCCSGAPTTMRVTQKTVISPSGKIYATWKDLRTYGGLDLRQESGIWTIEYVMDNDVSEQRRLGNVTTGGGGGTAVYEAKFRWS